VLEDAEALMRVRGGGRAVGTLLNLADGLLGQGLRCLFLLTTNQTLEQVHPALLRPGRCLSLLEFGALSAAEAAVLRGGPVARSMTLAEAMSPRGRAGRRPGRARRLPLILRARAVRIAAAGGGAA
jgi:hypothetical protein